MIPFSKYRCIDLSDIIPNETVTLTVYSQLSNYEGEQIGWFADIMKEKFNVKLNIISNGDGVCDSRMESEATSCPKPYTVPSEIAAFFWSASAI